MSTTTPDYGAVTKNQQQTWSSGDFAVIARSIVPVSEALVESADPHAGQRLLDVACGSGNTALVAARRYCEVSGIDYVPALIERAQQRASAEGLPVRFAVGDAQALPYEDGSFDFVLSTFGVMFAPNQALAASELSRVCRSGGTIGLSNWTPEGEVGEFFRMVSKWMPPPPGLTPPTRWGTEQGLRELFADRVQSLRCERRRATQYYRSAEHAVDTFLSYFGPTHRAAQSLDEGGRRELRGEMLTLFSGHNRATDGTLVVSFEYLQALLELS